MLLEYTHPVLNQEITAIGGYYIFMKEASISYQSKTVLYFIGCSQLNSSCCGVGGVSFAHVAGFLRQPKYKNNADGTPISLVEPISYKADQIRIRRLIQQREMVHQVEFISGSPTFEAFLPG